MNWTSLRFDALLPKYVHLINGGGRGLAIEDWRFEEPQNCCGVMSLESKPEGAADRIFFFF